MDKKILLVDTSFSAKPIYDYLITTDADVYVVGGKLNDSLAKSVKNYINLDYSNIVELKKLICRLGIDYLVPGGNDFSYKVCSEISKDIGFFNIDAPQINETINNKQKFRNYSLALGLHVPNFISVEEIEHNLPVIVKPADAYSGHGMTIIKENRKKEIENAIELAKEYSKSNQYLIEEFIEGQLFSHSAFIVNREILIDFFVEEHCFVNPHVVDTSYVVSNFNHNLADLIRKDILTLAENLQLSDGLIHTQFICRDDSFWLIEITRRCPGDLYSLLIEYTTGFPYAQFYAKPFLDQELNFDSVPHHNKKILRHTITQAYESHFFSLRFNTPLRIEDFIPLKNTGEIIERSPFSRIGIIFLLTNTEIEMIRFVKMILNKKLYSIN